MLRDDRLEQIGTPAVDVLLARMPRDAIVVPGHGHPLTYADVVGYRSMLDGMIDSVRARLNAHESIDDVRKNGVPAPWRSWPRVIPDDYVLGNIYEGLQRDP